jgi:hypothetical protein
MGEGDIAARGSQFLWLILISIGRVPTNNWSTIITLFFLGEAQCRSPEKPTNESTIIINNSCHVRS